MRTRPLKASRDHLDSKEYIRLIKSIVVLKE